MEKNKNEVTEVNATKFEKVFINFQYVVLALLIVGQCTVGIDFLIGQVVYLAANGISVARCYVLHRPAADKVKDWACTGITLGLIAIKLLNGLV